MSFAIDWEWFDQAFYDRAKRLLGNALNSSNRPAIIVDKIEVKNLYLGDKPPRLEILEIGDLGVDRFRGIFKVKYEGNAYVTLATKVEANPLAVYYQNAPQFSAPTVMGAASSLAMPLNVTLSEIVLSGIVIMVYSKAKGLTLVFRNDPLESIKVTSTFDGIPAIARFLQVQIEKQIRVLFRDELPGILHKLSQKYTNADKTIPPTEPGSPKMKPVALAEINPDLPEISPANMLHLATLGASQRTLSLFTPLIPDAVYRSNLEGLEKGTEKGHRSAALSSEGDVQELLQAQARAHTKNPAFKPKRRVIRLNLNKSKNLVEESTTIETPANLLASPRDLSSRRTSMSDATTVVDPVVLPPVDIPDLSLDQSSAVCVTAAPEKPAELPPTFEEAVAASAPAVQSYDKKPRPMAQPEAKHVADVTSSWGDKHEPQKRVTPKEQVFQEFFCANGYLRLGKPGPVC